MLRTLIVIAALALSGCATYGGNQYGEHQAVYRDGSYYSPSADGYGDYYYAPEYRYHDSYYDYGFPYSYGGYPYSYGYPYGYRYGRNWCGLRYRPCPGSWHSGWGLSIFFGNGWYGGWNRWPHYYDDGHHWRRDRNRNWDRDRDWRDRDRDHGSNDTQDRNRRMPDPGMAAPEPPRDIRSPDVRMPGGDRNRRYGDDRYQPAPPRVVREVRGPGPGPGYRDVNARPEPQAEPPPPPAPRESTPRVREERSSNDADRPAPRRTRSESGDTRRGIRRGDDD
jgi:hypothetical protein